MHRGGEVKEKVFYIRKVVGRYVYVHHQQIKSLFMHSPSKIQFNESAVGHSRCRVFRSVC